jgi:hypothetical protein
VTAVYVVELLSSVAGAAVVIALFVWAARRDGERDREVQRQTGVPRRTRLGR